MGLWLLVAWLVPVLITGLPDVVGVVIAVLLLAAGLGAFFLSLAALHRQMVEVKKRELEVGRTLYPKAYDPSAKTRPWKRSRDSSRSWERRTRWTSARVPSTTGRSRKERGRG
jgi:hypothetical protein